MNPRTRLQLLAINDTAIVRSAEVSTDAGELDLDEKSLALVRLAALVAAGGAVASYGALADAAIGCGATKAEIVDLLFGVAPVVGTPCIVAAAPRLALALGYDVDAGPDLP